MALLLERARLGWRRRPRRPPAPAPPPRSGPTPSGWPASPTRSLTGTVTASVRRAPHRRRARGRPHPRRAGRFRLQGRPARGGRPGPDLPGCRVRPRPARQRTRYAFFVQSAEESPRRERLRRHPAGLGPSLDRRNRRPSSALGEPPQSEAPAETADIELGPRGRGPDDLHPRGRASAPRWCSSGCSACRRPPLGAAGLRSSRTRRRSRHAGRDLVPRSRGSLDHHQRVR